MEFPEREQAGSRFCRGPGLWGRAELESDPGLEKSMPCGVRQTQPAPDRWPWTGTYKGQSQSWQHLWWLDGHRITWTLTLRRQRRLAFGIH